MAIVDRFKQSVIVTLAKRAVNHCSNPDCGAITSGPADEPDRSVNVGEAAHIYGANPGSARHDAAMNAATRSAITNAIWLCSTCHKLIDDDPLRYPAGLLFEWQRAHEKQIAERIGKAGAHLRHRYETRHLEEFGKLSYLAERLILEKDDIWEYRLTSEVLRFEMAPILRRWNALSRNLYTLPVTRVNVRDIGSWLADRSSEAQRIATAFEELMNVEFQRAWGEPGIPGNDLAIVAACRLFAEMCGSALRWEEQVRFTVMHEAFDDVLALHKGVTGGMIDEAAKLPRFMSDTFNGEVSPGEYALNLTLTLPDGWAAQTSEAIQRATAQIVAEIQSGELQYQAIIRPDGLDHPPFRPLTG